MTNIDRIVRRILDDPWTSRVFLAFTVGMFLSCSAEFAASQEPGHSIERPALVGVPHSESTVRGATERMD